MLGGSLTVDSTYGLGSTFTVKIPAQFGRFSATAPLTLTAPLAGPVILLIEDNSETSFVHQSSLKHIKYQTVCAANIPEARLFMRQIKPVLVLMDRLIDQSDSLYYIEELRSQHYSGQILVVSVVDDSKSAIGAGANAFLAKPVPPFTLLNAVRELIEGTPSKAILLVDDDEVTRYLVGGVLAKHGYKVLEAHGGREAMMMPIVTVRTQ